MEIGFNKLSIMLKRLFRAKQEVEEVILLPKSVIQNANVQPLPYDTITSKIAEELNTKTAENPINQVIIDMLRKDGLSDAQIMQFFNKEQKQMYRFVGEGELKEIMQGNTVKSTRPCHQNFNRTDITSNPNYGNIATLNKYRVKFKFNDKFNPHDFGNGTSKVDMHALENEEYYLYGGYSLNDIEKIEQNSGQGYRQIYP